MGKSVVMMRRKRKEEEEEEETYLALVGQRQVPDREVWSVVAWNQNWCIALLLPI